MTSLKGCITTKMEFKPEVHQHSAGLIMYYDNMNYINLRKYYSETLGQSALSIIHLENGEKTEQLKKVSEQMVLVTERVNTLYKYKDDHEARIKELENERVQNH